MHHGDEPVNDDDDDAPPLTRSSSIDIQYVSEPSTGLLDDIRTSLSPSVCVVYILSVCGFMFALLSSCICVRTGICLRPYVFAYV